MVQVNISKVFFFFFHKQFLYFNQPHVEETTKGADKTGSDSGPSIDDVCVRFGPKTQRLPQSSYSTQTTITSQRQGVAKPLESQRNKQSL